jgi:outer membrane protein assembly factor BamE (lipoprotein component of BamABCDE complex)
MTKAFKKGSPPVVSIQLPLLFQPPPVAAPTAATDATLMYGQTKGHVRVLLGQPHTVTGTEADLFWWYYVSHQEMFYILNFQHGIYVEAFKGTRQEILELLQQPREERKNLQWY